jgi:hypothetical protein
MMIDLNRLDELNSLFKSGAMSSFDSVTGKVVRMPTYEEFEETIRILYKENAELKEKVNASKEVALDTWESEGGEVGC